MKFQLPHKGRTAGASAAELIIYIALFTLLSAVLIDALLVMLHSYTAMRMNHDLLDSGTVAMERMSREIRLGQSLGSTSVYDTSPGTLELDSTVSGSARTVTFSVSSGVLDMSDSMDSATNQLTGGKVSVSSLIFRKITTAKGYAVKVELTLSETAGPRTQTANFYDTVVLRGAYN